ncbi:cuticle protein 10.9 [Trichonephila inaurata madagascariensis]|uniref:Cuticle protein 10.9 n=1 Tax=Trichonephila inaurata madagascariensis TaxID=2747483 RepID=A0A8X6ME70_9ARAC|nr:cuticle protein 10.9 [Trichonephila inaurata madagascariensis]
MSPVQVALLVLAISVVALAGPAVPASPLLTIQELSRPYEFGYEFGDGLGMTQHRREVADGTGAVKGGYGYRDPLGCTETSSTRLARTDTRPSSTATNPEPRTMLLAMLCTS